MRNARLVCCIVFLLCAVCACGPGRSLGSADVRSAPDFALKDIHGKLVRLSDSAGQVRLVDFWATWCAPCREAIPDLKELHAGYADKGLTLLAISMDEDDPEKLVPSFVEKNQIAYTNLLGTPEVAQAFGGVMGLPTTFLIDRDGKIRETYIGGTPKEVLEKRIRELLGLATTG